MKPLVCLFLIAVQAAPAFAQEETPPSPRLSRADTVRATRALVRWFECDECEEGELAAVTRYGQHVVPSLIAALEHGPSPASRELLRAELVKRHAALVQSPPRPQPQGESEGGPRVSDVETFVHHYMGNFEAQYQIRAAQALAEVKGPKAGPALKKALARATRGDVQQAIESSLAKLK